MTTTTAMEPLALPKEESGKEENYLMVNPNFVEEENNARIENSKREENDEGEDAASEDLTESERYEKLCQLLAKSKFYSDFLLKKMSEEDDEMRTLKKNKKGNKRVLVATSVSASNKKAKRSSSTLINGEPVPASQPDLLVGGVMRDYQIEGYQWMASLFENGINGILADEMGMGKTIQTIALLCHLVEMGVSGPFLIVAPLSTLPNWKREFERFAPSLLTVVYHGTKVERAQMRRKLSSKCQTTFITSFNIAMNDAAQFKRVKWMYLVVDEGHRLKNANCKLIMELKQYNVANKLLLTGTPLQNNLDELWSLLNFIMGEIFHDIRVFRSWFNTTDMHENDSDEADRIVKQEQRGNILSTLHQILTPFLLRRVKSDVDLKIPPKKEVLVYCPMTEVQRVFYEAVVNRTIDNLIGGNGSGSSSSSSSSSSSIGDKQEGRRRSRRSHVNYKVFSQDAGDADEGPDVDGSWMESHVEQIDTFISNAAYTNRSSDVNYSMKNRMMDLRKITNHPYLIEYPLTEDGNFYRSDKDMVNGCGKLKVLDQMLDELIKGKKHKVLLFSQMTRMLDILGDYLNWKGVRFSRLDGSVDFESRQTNIDEFSNDPDVCIFLLSTRAGGLGINLTAADTVIIYDSDWNPQQDLQAQDRAHRIGQTQPVMIYRLVTANTIDEKIVERAAAKRKLEKLVIHSKKFKSQDVDGLTKTMESVSQQELLDLLNSKDHVGVIDRKDGQIFTAKELDLLLDRSDLAWHGHSSSRSSVKNGGKIFKVVDSAGICNGGGLASVCDDGKQ